MKRYMTILLVLLLIWLIYSLLKSKKNKEVKEELYFITKDSYNIKTNKDKEELIKRLNLLEKRVTNKKTIEEIKVVRSKILGITIEEEIIDIKEDIVSNESINKDINTIKKGLRGPNITNVNSIKKGLTCPNIKLSNDKIVTIKTSNLKKIENNIKKINKNIVNNNIKKLEKEVKKSQIKQLALIPVMLPISNVIIKKNDKIKPKKVVLKKGITSNIKSIKIVKADKPKLTKVYLPNTSAEILIDLKKSNVLASSKLTKSIPKKIDIKKLEKEIKKEQMKQLILIPAMVPLVVLFDKSNKDEVSKFLREHNYTITHNELSKYEVNELKELMKKNKKNETLKKIYKTVQNKDKAVVKKEEIIKKAEEEELKKKKEVKKNKEQLDKYKKYQANLIEAFNYMRQNVSKNEMELKMSKSRGINGLLKKASSVITKCSLLAGGLLLGLSSPFFLVADAFLLNSYVRSLRRNVTNKNVDNLNISHLMNAYNNNMNLLDTASRLYNDSLYQLSAFKNDFIDTYGSLIYVNDEVTKMYNSIIGFEDKFMKEIKQTDKRKDELKNKIKVLTKD